MHIAPLLTPLLAIIPTFLGGPVPGSSNTTSTAVEVRDLKPISSSRGKESGWGIHPISSGPHSFVGKDCGWSFGYLVYHHDKFKMVQYAQPGCKGQTVHTKAKSYKADKVYNLKHKHRGGFHIHGHYVPTESIRYALPPNAHMNFVDITFYDQYIKKGHNHYCGGNVVLKIDGAKDETIEGDRDQCFETPGAKCMTVSPTWTDREHTGRHHKRH